jgi:hypothetical protein
MFRHRMEGRHILREMGLGGDEFHAAPKGAKLDCRAGGAINMALLTELSAFDVGR